MNYLLYVLAAYTVTFVIIGWMFTANYVRYLKAKSEVEEAKQQGKKTKTAG